MNSPRFLLLLCLLITTGAYANTPDTERVLWDKQPITITLAVGQERLIHFEHDVRVWIPDALQSSIRILSANGVLYLQSSQPFTKTRFRVQALGNHRVYLLDIVSQSYGEFSNNLIITDKATVNTLATPDSPAHSKQDWPIRLMRFAAQSLYAPERLSPVDHAIARMTVASDPVRLLRGADTEATPLAQWSGGGLYVTAVLLKNTTNRTITIAPEPAQQTTATYTNKTLYLNRDLRGQWLYAAVQHSTLAQAGSDADRTCLYLVSKRPFVEML